MIQENATFTNPNPNQAAFLDQLQSKHLEKQTLLTLSEVLERRNHRRVTEEQPATSNTLLKGRLHDRAKMARIRQKLERFQQFLQRNRELLSVPQRVHRRLWTPNGTNKSSLFLCKNYWNRSSFLSDPCHFFSVV